MNILVAVVDWLNRRGKGFAIRLTRWTGKHPTGIAPKHLIPDGLRHDWYMMHLRPSDRVLDVGCGSGRHAVRAAPAVRSIVGVDRARPDAAGRWVQADLEQGLPFRDGAFDALLMLDVIEHLDARQPMLREARRVLVPHGLLFITGPNRQTRWRQRLRDAGLFACHDPDHKTEYVWPEFVNELLEGGFLVMGPWDPIVYDTPWAGLIDVIGGLSLCLYARLVDWKWRMAWTHPEESTGFAVVAMRTP